jgi:hypothetical protein
MAVPADLTDLIGHWVASVTGDFTFASGSLFSQWNDKSGGAHHWQQATGANQMLRTGTLNGLNVVDTDAGFMVMASPTDLVTDGTMSVSATCKLDAAVNAGGDRMFLTGDGNGNPWDSATAFDLGVHDGTAWPRVRRGGGAGVSIGSSVDMNDWHIVTIRFDGTNAYLYRDGTLVGSQASTGNFNIDRIYLGAWPDATSATLWEGQIAEIIWWGSGVDADRTAMEAYQTTKWFTAGAVYAAPDPLIIGQGAALQRSYSW